MMSDLLTRDEIIVLINELEQLLKNDLEGREFELRSEELHDALINGVLDPSVLDYIYLEKTELTPEQIADRALAYKPIILPDESQS